MWNTNTLWFEIGDLVFSAWKYLFRAGIMISGGGTRIFLQTKKKNLMISKYVDKDFSAVHEVINDGASAYKGIIPADRWHEPYMSEEELKTQMEEGVEFWCYSENGNILGVMGIQDKREVTLIRHAYVRSSERKKGIGGKLLEHLRSMTSTPILIGTWADARWAIDFYRKHGFQLLAAEEIKELLHTYWRIPERQVETSVVLASQDWFPSEADGTQKFSNK